jgi:multicomponent Na+:H+ antiporter subunit F
MQTWIDVSLATLALALVLSFYRLVKGPHVADRIAIFDLLTAIICGLCSLLSVTTQTPVLFDIAVLVCLVSFLGTATYAALLEKRGADNK